MVAEKELEGLIALLQSVRAEFIELRTERDELCTERDELRTECDQARQTIKALRDTIGRFNLWAYGATQLWEHADPVDINFTKMPVLIKRIDDVDVVVEMFEGEPREDWRSPKTGDALACRRFLPTSSDKNRCHICNRPKGEHDEQAR